MPHFCQRKSAGFRTFSDITETAGRSETMTFDYIDKTECQLKKEKACCCVCELHLRVLNHCCHGKRESRCICGDHLGFYVCRAFDSPDPAMGGYGEAHLSGAHGLCEMFTQRKPRPGGKE
jgi:hypothetical protein